MQPMPAAIRVQLTVIGPLLFGAVAGFLLVLQPVGYWVVTVLSVLGGLAGGVEEAGRGAAARRGALGGASFGIGQVLAQLASGLAPRLPVPSPIGLLVLICAGLGTVFAYAGAGVRRATV